MHKYSKTFEISQRKPEERSIGGIAVLKIYLLYYQPLKVGTKAGKAVSARFAENRFVF